MTKVTNTRRTRRRKWRHSHNFKGTSDLQHTAAPTKPHHQHRQMQKLLPKSNALSQGLCQNMIGASSIIPTTTSRTPQPLKTMSIFADRPPTSNYIRQQSCFGLLQAPSRDHLETVTTCSRRHNAIKGRPLSAPAEGHLPLLAAFDSSTPGF